jgi:DNA-binding response OmpR family regulator
MKILLVEDEIEMQKYHSSLKNIVEIANDFNSAYEKIQVYEYDCVLLDITLPNGNGLDLIKTIKRIAGQNRIIIISAKNSFDDKIDGLNLELMITCKTLLFTGT